MSNELLQKMLEICENNLSEGDYLQACDILKKTNERIIIEDGIEYTTTLFLYNSDDDNDDDAFEIIRISNLQGGIAYIKIGNQRPIKSDFYSDIIRDRLNALIPLSIKYSNKNNDLSRLITFKKYQKLIGDHIDDINDRYIYYLDYIITSFTPFH